MSIDWNEVIGKQFVNFILKQPDEKIYQLFHGRGFPLRDLEEEFIKTLNLTFLQYIEYKEFEKRLGGFPALTSYIVDTEAILPP